MIYSSRRSSERSRVAEFKGSNPQPFVPSTLKPLNLWGGVASVALIMIISIMTSGCWWIIWRR